MGAGQYYDPRRLPQSQEHSDWTLITHPDYDREHVWVRSLDDFEVTVTRKAGEWWEIEIRNKRDKIVYDAQASSGVSAFAKVSLWWNVQQPAKRAMEKAS